MTNASVPAERLEALANEIDKFWDSDYNAHDAAARIRALLAEAREEGKPTVFCTCGTRPVSDPHHAKFCPMYSPASAGTEGPIERVARALARSYWQGRGETITREQEDEFWLSWGRDAEAALARVEGEKK